jgi:hypothetical protein
MTEGRRAQPSITPMHRGQLPACSCRHPPVDGLHSALAHNMLRWTQLLGLPDTTIRAARTLRRRLLQVPGRLTRHARGWTLHLPARWPWHGDYTRALNRIRALPGTT